MRIERLTNNKIKIFITTDDLSERGLTKEDIWKDSLKWHQLFHDMLEEASEEFGVNFEGSVAVEIFSLQAQGMIMIVTMDEEEVDTLTEGFIDMAVTAKDFEDVLFVFENIEHVIQLSKQLLNMNFSGGSLLTLNDRYYLYFRGELVRDTPAIISIMAEYGSYTLESIHWIEEYGKEIIKEQAIETLVKYFCN